MDFKSVSEEAFSGWWEGKAREYFFLLLMLQAVSLGIYFTAYYFFIGDAFFNIPYLGNLDAGLIEQLALINFYLMPVSIVYSFAAVYLNFLIVRSALKEFSFKTTKFDFREKLMAFVLIVVQLFAALFSVFDLRMLIILIGAVIFAALQFVGFFPEIFGVMILLLVFGYAIIAFRNFARLICAFPIFFSEGGKVNGVLRKSWEMTKRDEWKIIGFLAIITFVTGFFTIIMVYVTTEFGKILGERFGLLFMAALLPSLVNVVFSSLFAVWNNYFSAIVYREISEKNAK